MGGTWEANIYFNGNYRSTIKVKNDTPLIEIGQSLNINDNMYFISRNNGFIEIENNFTAKNVWKNDDIRNQGYKIDLMTRQYFNSNESGLVNIYKNTLKDKAIRYDPNMSLAEIMEVGGYDRQLLIPSEEDKYFFLSKGNAKIEDFEGLHAKDIVKFEDNGKRIDIVDAIFYKKFQVLEHLNELDSKTHFDWLEQTEFFKKVKNLCGEEVANAVINELCNDIKDGKPKANKEYIRKFRELLIKETQVNKYGTKDFDLDTQINDF